VLSNSPLPAPLFYFTVIGPKMSFFGFDTTLPNKKGFFDNSDPFAEVARARAAGQQDDDDDA
jgi:hypothetical protein